MYYKGTEQECLDYNDKVVAGRHYNSTTTRWATPTKHQTLNEYIIIKHKSFDTKETEEGEETMELLESIPDGWVGVE